MYPDTEDKISLALFRQWHISYYTINGLCIEMAKSYIFSNKRKLLIDVGCGTGSMIDYFITDFRKIIAIDIDKERLLKAKQRLKCEVKKEKILFICADIGKISLSIKADFIIFKDILQHIPTYALEKVLRNLQQLVSNKGYILFAFPVNFHREFYVLCHKNFQNGSSIICNEIDEKTFNVSCYSKSNQRYLVAHIFHFKKVISLIEKYFYFHKISLLRLNSSSFELVAIGSKHKNDLKEGLS